MPSNAGSSFVGLPYNPPPQYKGYESQLDDTECNSSYFGQILSLYLYDREMIYGMSPDVCLPVHLL